MKMGFHEDMRYIAWFIFGLAGLLSAYARIAQVMGRNIFHFS